MIVIVLYKDMFNKLDAKLNRLLYSSRKKGKTFMILPYWKNIYSDLTQLPIQAKTLLEDEIMSDTSSFNDVIETHFNSLNDPPPTPVFDDGYCIYQTPTLPSRINDFTPNSRTSSVMDQNGYNFSSGNQHSDPFGYLPVLVPGIVHYSPCWLPSWGGWIASWISWMSPPTWIWPSFV